MMSLSFFFSAAVTAVRVRSLLEPEPQPCNAKHGSLALEADPGVSSKNLGGQLQLAMSGTL